MNMESTDKTYPHSIEIISEILSEIVDMAFKEGFEIETIFAKGHVSPAVSKYCIIFFSSVSGHCK